MSAVLALGTAWLASQPRLGAEPSENVRFEQLGVEDGLSHTTVRDVHQDRRGFVWIATETSLQRYDGYDLKSYQHDPEDESSLSRSEVIQIHEDRRGRLWLATRDRGVNRYDRPVDSFVRYAPWPVTGGVQNPYYIRAMADDEDGNLWIASHSGLVRLEPASGETELYTHRDDDPDSLAGQASYAVEVDRHGHIWAGLDWGLDRLEPDSGRIVHYRPAPEATDPMANGVLAIYEDPRERLWIVTADAYLHRFDREADAWIRTSRLGGFVAEIQAAPDGRLWAASYGGGLYRVDPDSGAATPFRHQPDNRESLASDNVLRLDWDRSGILWVATRDGISLYDAKRSAFRVLRHLHDGRGLAGRTVTSLAEGRDGTVWIGFDSGDLTAWDRAAGTLDRIDGEARLGGLLALYESASGELLCGFERGLARLDRRRQAFVPDAAIPEGFSVRAIAEDRRGTLWLGTFGLGLARLDPRADEVEPLPTEHGRTDAIPSDFVYRVLIDSSGRVWAASEKGLSRVDPDTGEITTWLHDPARPESLSFEHLVDLYEDRSGRLWIATYGGGLDRYDADGDVFHHYRERDGLANNKVVGVLEDARGRLWVSTNRGLSCLDPETGAFRNFYVDDGLSSNVFLIGGRVALGDGNLVFGGHDGLTSFSPGELADDPVAPPVVITKLLLQGSAAEPGAPGSPLTRAMAETRELTLSHRQASFSLEFAALHFANPRKNLYAFRLEPYDTEWIETDAAHRRARYTNLDPGEYVFRVRASNQDGVWNDDGATLSVRILPPLWKTWWAYTLYGLAAVAGAVGYERWHRRRLERERRINAQLREVDRVKNEFLANTSHELRTPLYGITGLAESLLDGVHGALPGPARNDLTMIVDSGRRLTGLVNDILDFSRLRDRELDLALKPLDVNTVVGLVLTLLRPLTHGKDVRLVNAVDADLPAVEADENRLQQILVNLVGNAVKFTERGEVEVRAEAGDGKVRIVVADTGIGIDPEHLERIFEPFEQIDGAADRRFGGTGLGLAVTRHLVELHGGRLEARSTPGEGSRFSFSLPLATERPAVAAQAEDRRSKPAVLVAGDPEEAFERPRLETSDEAPTVLIVDDELVVRQVLANQLSQAGYRYVQAASGRDALDLLDHCGKRGERGGFDLVLLDIMMPRMSGFEVCREIRRRYLLDELPVIYLTARSRVEDLVQGFATGASDFLSKPISRDELISRVRTHLELARLHRNLEELVEERTAQVKTLRGLLPVCASCKKIRDDDGYWNDLEVYLSAHSEAQLTHGLCFDCAQKLYPEIEFDRQKSGTAP